MGRDAPGKCTLEIPQNRYSQHLSKPGELKEGRTGGHVLKLGIDSSAAVGKRQIFKSMTTLISNIFIWTILKAKGKQTCLVYMVIPVSKQISPLLHLPRAGDIPSCEESGDGNKLISFSLSLFLLSVGVKDMFSCLGGSTSSSFSELAVPEGDIPAKENKGQVKSSRENEVCLCSVTGKESSLGEWFINSN